MAPVALTDVGSGADVDVAVVGAIDVDGGD